MSFRKSAVKLLLAFTLAFPFPVLLTDQQSVSAEGPSDPAPYINAKVINENAGKKVLFDNTHGQTAGAADWVIDGSFSDFANALAYNGFYVQELRKLTPITYDDLKNYDVFAIGEANIPYKKTEQDAMLQYVQNGGSIFFIADHYNADRNKNRWDASEVMNGYRRGAWDDPAKGMSPEERSSSAMQGVVSSDWLGTNFGVRFRYNALGDINATNPVTPSQSLGITNGVNSIAMHAGSTVALLDPTKAKGIVYLPDTNKSWLNAVDQGVYEGGGIAEGPFAAIAKVGAGKAAFIGDSSPIEDATPKYLREENGKPKVTYDGFKEQDDASFLVNTVNWLAKKESYTAFNQIQDLQLDSTTTLLDFEEPQASTEPQPEPWAAPDSGYKWWDSSTFKAGSFGSAAALTSPAYSFQHQASLPNAQQFQIRVLANNLVPNSTVTGYSAGIYLTGGLQVAQIQNPDGTWPTTYGYSTVFSLTADSLGHAYKDVTVRVKPGITGTANLRLRINGSAVFTEAVTLANVPVEPLPDDKPPVPATISISDARSKANGTIVTVEGIVTTPPGAYGGQGFYLQDSTGGIYVFQNKTGFSMGDKLKISAETAAYNSELELSNPIQIEKTGTGDLPVLVTAFTINEQNLGQIIKLENIQISNLHQTSADGTFEFDAVNGTNSTRVRVDARTGLNFAGFPYHNGQIATISGASSIFKGTFQLKPRGLFDFDADTQPPTTQAVVSALPNQFGWYNQNLTVTLNAIDDRSGIATTEYSLNDRPLAIYTEPLTIDQEGADSLLYRSTDTSGNTENTKSFSLHIDKTSPNVSVTLSGEQIHDVSILDKLNIALAASDVISGVQSQELYLDGQAIQSRTEISALDLGLGTHTLQARVSDFAGNITEYEKTFTVDTSLAAIHELLTQLYAAGEIKNQGIETSLSSKLKSAERSYLLHLSDQAVKHLLDLEMTLQTYVKTQNISEHSANLLIQNIEFLLEHGLQ